MRRCRQASVARYLRIQPEVHGGRPSCTRAAAAGVALLALISAAGLLWRSPTPLRRHQRWDFWTARTLLTATWALGEVGSEHGRGECAGWTFEESCGWTLGYSCPGQPAGSLGQASDDGGVGYACCCEQRLWQRAAAPASRGGTGAAGEPASRGGGAAGRRRRGAAGELQAYRVDNGVLNATTSGLAYRRSMDMEDKGSRVQEWDTVVDGVEESGGWVKVRGLFLPLQIHGVAVLKLLEPQEAMRMREDRDDEADRGLEQPPEEDQPRGDPTRPPASVFEATADEISESRDWQVVHDGGAEVWSDRDAESSEILLTLPKCSVFSGRRASSTSSASPAEWVRLLDGSGYVRITMPDSSAFDDTTLVRETEAYYEEVPYGPCEEKELWPILSSRLCEAAAEALGLRSRAGLVLPNASGAGCFYVHRESMAPAASPSGVAQRLMALLRGDVGRRQLCSSTRTCHPVTTLAAASSATSTTTTTQSTTTTTTSATSSSTTTSVTTSTRTGTTTTTTTPTGTTTTTTTPPSGNSSTSTVRHVRRHQHVTSVTSTPSLPSSTSNGTTSTLTSVTSTASTPTSTTPAPVNSTSGSLHHPTLFCWSVVTPGGYETGLVATQYRKRASIFNCDGFAVLSAADGAEIGPLDVIKIPDTDGGSEKGVFDNGRVTTNSFLNSQVFVQAWGVVLGQTRAASMDWVAKVDPDAVFFPERLRRRVAEHMAGGGETVFYVNCNKAFGPDDEPIKLYGSLEVFSQGAMRAFQEQKHRCEDELDWHGWGEDYYMSHCMDLIGVARVEDFDSFSDKRCNSASCDDATKVSFHDFKDEGSWFSCWEASLGEGGVKEYARRVAKRDSEEEKAKEEEEKRKAKRRPRKAKRRPRKANRTDSGMTTEGPLHATWVKFPKPSAIAERQRKGIDAVEEEEARGKGGLMLSKAK